MDRKYGADLSTHHQKPISSKNNVPGGVSIRTIRMNAVPGGISPEGKPKHPRSRPTGKHENWGGVRGVHVSNHKKKKRLGEGL